MLGWTYAIIPGTPTVNDFFFYDSTQSSTQIPTFYI